MGKVTIAFLLLSTAAVLIAFTKGMSILHGGEVLSHLQWSLVALIAVLVANSLAMIHAAQSDRVIRDLRRQLAALAGEARVDGPNVGGTL
jgi:hypothetical protein